jgi:hypothetical protein
VSSSFLGEKMVANISGLSSFDASICSTFIILPALGLLCHGNMGNSGNDENDTKELAGTVQVKTSVIWFFRGSRITSSKRQNPLLCQRTGPVSLG